MKAAINFKTQKKEILDMRKLIFCHVLPSKKGKKPSSGMEVDTKISQCIVLAREEE